MHLYYLPELQSFSIDSTNWETWLNQQVGIPVSYLSINNVLDDENNSALYDATRADFISGDIWIDWQRYIDANDLNSDDFPLLDDHITIQETADNLLYINTTFHRALPEMKRLVDIIRKRLLSEFGGKVSLDDQQTWLTLNQLSNQENNENSYKESVVLLRSDIRNLIEEPDEPEINDLDISEMLDIQWLPRPTI